MLMEEIKHSLITTLILLLDFRVFEIGSRSHPSVDLVWEPFNDMRDFEPLFPFLDVLFGLVFGGEHGVGDCDARGVGGGYHGWVAGCGGFEGGVFLGGEVYDLGGAVRMYITRG